ncbi:MAG: YjbH domain-containing protein, partial [Paracoccus sp. (in: a-proteobacteria)]|nr:YjbH domain-containing protein [Paracoccus sp. (in: a-proteobacteria)]
SVGHIRDTWESDSPVDVPVVRGDSALSYGQSGPTIPRLSAACYAHPTETVYTRVTAGLLEPAFGGVSAEVLWKPNDSRLALGAEINRVKKREYEQRFGFEDYEVTTGHLSAYYDFGSGFFGRVDAGQYLAGDRGVTVALDREFANGWKVGAYVSKTDMSAEDFGEGSYDKGISILVPLSWGLGTPSQKYTGGSVRSMNRDGAARLDVEGRLYDTVRDSQKGKIYQGWGNFWR